MILKNHIATRFLTDYTIINEFISSMYSPEAVRAWDIFTKSIKDDDIVGEFNLPIEVKEIGMSVIFLSEGNEEPNINKNYYVTETVTNKLDMLKVARKSNGFYDWTVFNDIPLCKKTYILHDGSLIRFNKTANGMHFVLISYTPEAGNKGHGLMEWDMFYTDSEGNQFSDKVKQDRIHRVDTLIYKLLCFIYLTENDETIVEPGRKNGTKKSGKIVNTLPYSVTIIDSRWNTTVIRTEGFDVSGHFRLQPYGPQMSKSKIIFIQPFKKQGYIRKAKSA